MKKTCLTLFLLFLGTITFAQNWYEVSTPTTAKLNAIDFVSETIGYIVGEEGTLLKTTDGGQTWSQVNYTGISAPVGLPSFSDIDFIDDTIGFIVAQNQSPGAYKTLDGGLTWTADEHQQSNMCYKNSVYAFASNKWFLAGAGCFQSAMIDAFNFSWGTTTINYESFNPDEYVAEMDFNGNTGLAATNSPYMLRSTDAGYTWDTISVGLSASGKLTSVMFVDALTCYAGYDEGGSGFGVLRSDDGGVTWYQDINSATFFYPSYLGLTSANNGDVYIGGAPSLSSQGIVFETTDGVNWLYETVDHAIHDMDSYLDDVTFGVGDSGYVIVNVPPATLSVSDTDIEELDIYPNPTSDFVTVKYDGTLSEIELIDLFGRPYPIRLEQSIGECSIDLRALPLGTYILKYRYNGRQRSSRIVIN